jgi:hypothetical protein
MTDTNTNIQAIIAQEIAKAVAQLAPAPAPAPATPDYFAQAEVNRKEANRLQKLAVESLPVLQDESTFSAIQNSVITGVQCEETTKLNKAGGFRLSDDQKELKKIAQLAHVTEINSDEFKANLTAQIDVAELKSFKQSLPSKKTGEVTRSVSW